MNSAPANPNVEVPPKRGGGESMLIVVAESFFPAACPAQILIASIFQHILTRRLQCENLLLSEVGIASYSFDPFIAVLCVTDRQLAACAIRDEMTRLNSSDQGIPLLRWTLGILFQEESAGDGSAYWRLFAFGTPPALKLEIPPHDLNKLGSFKEICQRFHERLGEAQEMLRLAAHVAANKQSSPSE